MNQRISPLASVTVCCAVLACATSSPSASPADELKPEGTCTEWRIEVSNGGPAEVSVYYQNSGRRTFLDGVGAHSSRTFFVTLDWKPSLWFTVERSGNNPMSVNQSKLIKHSVTCANQPQAFGPNQY